MKSIAFAAFTLMAAAAPALSQDARYTLELNNARAAETGCRLTYVAMNATGTDLSATSFEVAVFDQDGKVNRLLILEFGALKDGRTKVVQFDLAEQGCEDISRLLVNSVAECSATEGTAPDCLDVLEASSRTDIDFGL
ncbi:hypothetical protein CLV78_101165 [Aliiruegeria haliotis]|uniref:Tat pathway signal sequence domain protein n=1 Tax=Aliiruegeria haliotis TaxID=1280846 RepID=A0A2T0RY59_9RHOB|nr:hypothetical protein [Aliiruegeria haliotis]PRY26072.1 hypothetical protein CLV78_101165 [Aliiruegeria haliotis]